MEFLVVLNFSVKPAHEKFKFELKEALENLVEENLVEKSLGEELLVDKLMEQLEKRYPVIRRVDQSKVLADISKIFDTRLQTCGKKNKSVSCYFKYSENYF